MGFSKGWCKLIKSYISGAWFSVLINRKPTSFFSSTQGVRYGDSLSMVHIIIIAEPFSKTIKHQNDIGKWQGANISRTNISITHSLFLNDTLLFGLSSIQEASQIKHVL